MNGSRRAEVRPSPFYSGELDDVVTTTVRLCLLPASAETADHLIERRSTRECPRECPSSLTTIKGRMIR